MDKKETYKGYQIEVDRYDTYQVYPLDEPECRFIVALDDSKLCGHRKFDETSNNLESARAYIDWKTRDRGE